MNLNAYCPGCGAFVPPTLMPTDYFTCESCHLTESKTRLVKQWDVRHMLAGVGSGPAISIASVTTATLFDGLQTTTNYSTGAFSVVAGDGIVVCLASRFGAEQSNTPTVSLIGDSGTLGIVVGNGLDSALWGGIFFGRAATSGSRTIRADFSQVPNPVSSAMAVIRLRSSGVITIDRSNSQYSASSATPDSNFTGPLSASPEVLIGMLASANKLADAAAVWDPPFTVGQRDATANGSNDCCVSESRLSTTSRGSFHASATLTAVEVACLVASFRAA